MAKSTSRLQNDLSFLGFARNHVFVTVFGVVLPVLVFACFIGYPIIYTFYLSFFDWNGMSKGMKFVGWANYERIVQDKYFYIALLNNIKWLSVSLAFPATLGFLIAYVMKAGLIYAPSFLRTIVFFPVTMSLIAVGLMFLLILNPVFGAFNTLLQSVGLGFLVSEWFGDYRIAIFTLAFISGWAFTGMPMIFYHAGLGDVPKETFEAARIEGAGNWRMMWSVALPQLRPVTGVVVMLTLFESLRAFDLVAVLTKGAPFGRTNVLGYLIYLESFWNSRFGYAAALSIVVLLLASCLALLMFKTLIRGAFDE